MSLATGHKTRFWCSQDRAHKKKVKKSTAQDVKHRDTESMYRFDCSSRLNIACRRGMNAAMRLITISIVHHTRHTKYYDVKTPPEITAITRDNIEYSTPKLSILAAHRTTMEYFELENISQTQPIY